MNSILKKATLKEVANKAGVSIATVDRVITKRAKVSPHTKEKVLAVIEELAQQHTHHPISQKELKLGVIIESGATFIEALSQTIEHAKIHFAEQKIQLECLAIVDFDLSHFLQQLKQYAEQFDGLIVLSRELPQIVSTINKLVEQGTPVVTLTSDLNNCTRLSHAGTNQISAGRTAGTLMGHYLNKMQGDILLVMSATYTTQYERELGFRSVLRNKFPNLRIREAIKNNDSDEDSYIAICREVDTNSIPLGIYNTSGGNAGIAKALREKGLDHDIVFIAHELNKVTKNLLLEDTIDIIIDQNLEENVHNAVTLLGHYLRTGETLTIKTPFPTIITKENIGFIP
ncbi:LacI family DNA-binding transcriptional regulator [Marinomonas sp. THO17]|uniref:LacI family DNA-binding transcriptional regulator n=1 Tax=Marinomonas sp. THO17 TaxID=3149048 RepID=UPI00336BCC30